MAAGSSAGAVACPQPLAAAAAGDILERGGNAVDAAVAGAFAQGAVDPLMCGIGGTGAMLVFEVASQQAHVLDFRTVAPSRAHPGVYEVEEEQAAPSGQQRGVEGRARLRVRGHANYVGYRAAVLPTFVRGTFDAHARWGSLSWKTVLQPAIRLAADGFPVPPWLFRSWDPSRVPLSETPPARVHLTATEECARIYLKPDGSVYRVGETLRQPDYASTLERIAEGGAAVFYEGEVGQALARDVEANGGLFSMEDLRQCRSEPREPTAGAYRDYAFVTHGPPGMGPLEIEAMQILDCLDVGRFDPWSVEYLALLARVFQQVYADRLRYNGDPAFTPVPMEQFLSRQRAAVLAADIARNRGAAAAKPEPVASSTTHISVVDRHGNAAGCSHSNGDSAGVVTPGLGFLLNNHMHMYDLRPGTANGIEPGKKARFGVSPVMLLREGRAEIVSGSLSPFKNTAEIQALMHLLEFGLDAQSAVGQPRIHSDYYPDTIYVESLMPAAVVGRLEQAGFACKAIEMHAPLCMVVRGADGRLAATRDPRGDGGVWPAG